MFLWPLLRGPSGSRSPYLNRVRDQLACSSLVSPPCWGLCPPQPALNQGAVSTDVNLNCNIKPTSAHTRWSGPQGALWAAVTSVLLACRRNVLVNIAQSTLLQQWRRCVTFTNVIAFQWAFSCCLYSKPLKDRRCCMCACIVVQIIWFWLSSCGPLRQDSVVCSVW